MVIKNIYTGWRNWLNYDSLSPEIKEMAEKRGAICAQCPHLKASTTIRVIERLIAGIKLNVSEPTVSGMKCEICGCGFRQKVLDPNSECPYTENGTPAPKWKKV